MKNNTLEQELKHSIVNGKEDEVMRILRENPEININGHFNGNESPLQDACYGGHDKILELLLSRSDIKVNRKTQDYWYPFLAACVRGQTRCVELLLDDHRTNIFNDTDGPKRTPLWWAARGGHLEAIKTFIASGREIELGDPDDSDGDIFEVAKSGKHVKVVSLLKKFRKNPEKTRKKVRVDLKYFRKTASKLFALVIFLCDGLVSISQSTENEKAKRFFSIAAKLPLELQMILCHRTLGSFGDSFLSTETEPAFRALSRAFLY